MTTLDQYFEKGFLQFVFLFLVTAVICYVLDRFFNRKIDQYKERFAAKGINNKFYSAVDKIEDRRKRFIDSRIERAIDSMDDVYKGILSRIKGFRGNMHSVRLNEVLSKVRNRIKRKKDE